MSKAVSRMEINRKVRAVLVRHWIDLGRISILVTPGSLRLRGYLCRLPGVTTPLSHTTIDAMFRELRRIQGVQRVHGDFENWKQEHMGGMWKSLEEKAPGRKQKRTAHKTEGDHNAIDVTDVDRSYLGH